MKLDKLMPLLILIVIVIIAFIFVENSKNNSSNNNNNDYTHGKTVILNVTEYLNDGNYSINRTAHEFFNDYRSLKPGDILIIKGRIVQQPKYRHDPFLNINVTTLTISSPGKHSWPIVIYVKENVSNIYKVGDLIEVTLHIDYYDIYQEWNGETWHIYGEFPKECIIDGKYTGGEVIVSSSQVKKV